MRGFLALQLVIWFPYGVWCAFQPGFLAESIGLTATTPTAETEIRAMYGGLQMGVGILGGWAAWRPEHASGALAALVCLAGGLFAVRLLAAVATADTAAYTLAALAFEIVIAGCALAFLVRARAAAESPA
ncbi:MAG: DUF4345 family protein [Proteobacteria bacterium]|nr:DUF4345 family protein [Pseudomonadota bacterium]